MDWETLRANAFPAQLRALCATRTNVVFGQGVNTPRFLFVGEGPGQSEDEQGLPFVGRSGQLLDKYLFAIDLDRSQNCYIANIVKCRPPQNRDPLPAESEACMPWLREQFRLLKPKIVVCLGRIAAQRMIRPDFSVTKEHGQLYQKRAASCLWAPSTRQRCCAIRTTSLQPLLILLPCGTTLKRCANIPIIKTESFPLQEPNTFLFFCSKKQKRCSIMETSRHDSIDFFLGRYNACRFQGLF